MSAYNLDYWYVKNTISIYCINSLAKSQVYLLCLQGNGDWSRCRSSNKTPGAVSWSLPDTDAELSPQIFPIIRIAQSQSLLRPVNNFCIHRSLTPMLLASPAPKSTPQTTLEGHDSTGPVSLLGLVDLAQEHS